jgi:ribonucleoside-diphosphate reductase alpha chain
LSEDEKEEFGVLSAAVKAKMMAAEYGGPEPGAGDYDQGNGGQRRSNGTQTDAPPCSNCGWIMTRAGACYRCDNCGTTSGCG